MKYYTDYPFTELGDEPFKEAPIRECIINWYDGNKLCGITVNGKNLEVKSGYIYINEATYKTAINLSREELDKYYQE